MKRLFSLTCACALLILNPGSNARAESGFVAGVGGGVAFGYGDSFGNSGMVDGEFGYQWEDQGGPSVACVLALDYAELEYNYLGAGGRTLTGRDELLTVAPRVRVIFPVDDFFGWYMQGQVGVNFSDGILGDLGWGVGAGIDFRWSKLVQSRLGYQVLGDTNGNGFHGVLAAVSFRF